MTSLTAMLCCALTGCARLALLHLEQLPQTWTLASRCHPCDALSSAAGRLPHAWHPQGSSGLWMAVCNARFLPACKPGQCGFSYLTSPTPQSLLAGCGPLHMKANLLTATSLSFFCACRPPRMNLKGGRLPLSGTCRRWACLPGARLEGRKELAAETAGQKKRPSCWPPLSARQAVQLLPVASILHHLGCYDWLHRVTSGLQLAPRHLAKHQHVQSVSPQASTCVLCRLAEASGPRSWRLASTPFKGDRRWTSR